MAASAAEDVTMPKINRHAMISGSDPLATPHLAAAQDTTEGTTSTRPITIVVPFAPGGRAALCVRRWRWGNRLQ
jgi:hypothetical protein